MSQLSFAHFMDSLKIRQTPALIWYGAPGERIELSGRVLDNWVSKSANFLYEECDIEVGDTISLPAAAHWRSVALSLAALRVGAVASVRTGNDEAQDEPYQVAAGFSPEDFSSVDANVYALVEVAALGMRYMGEIPTDREYVDYTSEVRAYADLYMGFNQPTPDTPALSDSTHRQLMTRVIDLSQQIKEQVPEGVQALEVTGSPALAVAEILAVMHAGYAVIILDDRFDFTAGDRHLKIYADERAQILQHS
ncbi:TIGR03089 family protein [Rothia sp. ZJ1223]|uniref:TIGR03089 family protein n=1 Tax=Rothia sp. ZJ1223 TaxID=2811098 RepID=UPI00195EEBCB|nr:TIGR03089 family protein [Rothia sp. ZJ1223]MBM7051430.1 hypothetical protein [Rothia sp. ZJ1223]